MARSPSTTRSIRRRREIKGIKSAVAGRAQILVVPDLEAGNMLAKNLIFLAKADAAGLVLGARVPIILTSRADSVRTRMASCAVAVLYAHARRRGPSLPAADPMDTFSSSMPARRASSSRYLRPGRAELVRQIKGHMDGVGTRARLRVSGPDGAKILDREYGTGVVADVPAALHTAAPGCATSDRSSRPPSVTASCTAALITTVRS